MGRRYSSLWLDKAAVRERWAELEEIIRRSFSDAEFKDNYTIEDPVKELWEAVTEPQPVQLRHLIIHDNEGVIHGAGLCIPAQRLPDESFCDIGWVFTIPDQPHEERKIVFSNVMDTIHSSLKDLGFNRIVTTIGTKSGERALSGCFNYQHKPEDGIHNRWVKEL